MTADQRRRKVAEVRFRERYERERAKRAREEGQPETQSHADDEDGATPAPARRWERLAGTSGFRETTVSLTGTNPDVDRVLAQKFGSKRYSAERVREVEQALNRRLSGERSADEKVPVHQRPEPVERAVCPVDAVPLQVVSYTNTMKPATRRCPCCRRTEREMLEKGVDLRPVTEHVRDALNHAGWQKEHVIRRW